MHVSDLEPDVRVGEGIWGTLEDLLKTAETFLVLAALLIDYAQSKEDFVGFVEVQICRGLGQGGRTYPEKGTHTLVHSEDRSEGLFGVV